MAEKHPSRTTELAALITKRLEDLKMTAAGASKRAGLGRDAIRDIIRGSFPGPEKINALAHVLRLKPEELLALIPAPHTQSEISVRDAQKLRKPLDAIVTGKLTSGPLDLQLFKQGQPGMGGMTVDVPVTLIARPPPLIGRDEAYAVYVADDVNAPLIRVGHVAYVDPSRPISVGDLVRVFPLRSDPFLGTLVARQDDGDVQISVAAEGKPRIFHSGDLDRIERVVGILMMDI